MATTTTSPPPPVVHTPSTLQGEALDPTLTALSTLSLLNLRLSRLEYVLSGTSAPSTIEDQPPLHSSIQAIASKESPNILTQLHSLETRLTNLKRLDGLPGTLVRMVDSLRREHPELFPNYSSTSSRADEENSSQPLPTYELSHQATEILANSTLYTTTSAHLQTLQTLKIPPATLSAELVKSRPRLEEIKKRQESVDAQIGELKGRSAALVEWWVRNGVVGMGELWDDWEDRIRGCERVVRREERKKRIEMGEEVV